MSITSSLCTRPFCRGSRRRRARSQQTRRPDPRARARPPGGSSTAREPLMTRPFLQSCPVDRRPSVVAGPACAPHLRGGHAGIGASSPGDVYAMRAGRHAGCRGNRDRCGVFLVATGAFVPAGKRATNSRTGLESGDAARTIRHSRRTTCVSSGSPLKVHSGRLSTVLANLRGEELAKEVGDTRRDCCRHNDRCRAQTIAL